MRAFLTLALCLSCRPVSSTPVQPKQVDAAAVDASADAEIDAAVAMEPGRDAGPYEVKFSGDRNVYFAIPERKGPKRLMAMMHGVCNPPGYACGYWWPSAIGHGFLVCPEGNARCAWSCTDCRSDRKDGPPSWEESFLDMDRDLEKSIVKVMELYPGEIDREGAVLLGFSRGAYAAVIIAQNHPGRWPYLVLNEADTEVNVTQLKAAKVRAVVLMAGAIGLNAKPVQKTHDELVKAGFPSKLILMPNAAHYYSNDIAQLMSDAIDFFVAQETK
jgi:hypothetical protein